MILQLVMSKETALLKSMFSFTKTPLICSAPMLGTTGPDLITAVYKSGGLGKLFPHVVYSYQPVSNTQLGFLGAGFDLTNLSANLAQTHSLLPDITPLPIGVGVILFRADLSLFLSSLKPHPPAAVWFFAPETVEQLDTWIINTKSHYPEIKIFVQLGSVKELKALLTGPAGEGADVIVAQGVADSGGHGLCRGASVVGLVPELRSVIRESGRVLPVLAAGGIVDGRGAAAALALGR